jgi:tRNA/tmRNA/rRNA uracil-C5-methylase (TrmA/RlmC/RlmD family)
MLFLLIVMIANIKFLNGFRQLKPQNMVKIAFPYKLARSRYYSHGANPKIFLSFDPNNEVQSAPPKKFNAFPFTYHQEITIKIDSLSNLGQGVGRATLADGSSWVIFIPLVLAGEEVRIRIYRNMPSFSEADLVEVVTPSPDRVTPLCKYFASCGGCQYQHMNIDMQRFWKKSQVDDVLTRIGGLSNVAINDVIGTDQLYGYRSKITPHYDAPHKNTKAEDVKIGFQKRGTRSTVDIDQCIITTDAINAKYKEKREAVRQSIRKSLPKKGATLLFRECDDQHVEMDSHSSQLLQ